MHHKLLGKYFMLDISVDHQQSAHSAQPTFPSDARFHSTVYTFAMELMNWPTTTQRERFFTFQVYILETH